MNETKTLPPTLAESLAKFEAFRPTLEALLAAQQNERPSPPPPTETTEEALKSPVPPQGDPSAEKTGGAATAAGQPDDSLIKAARAARDRAIDANLDQLTVSSEAVRALLEKRGVELGIGDNGAPAIGLSDGEALLSYEALRSAGVPDSLLRSRGVPGAGLSEKGGAAQTEDIVEKGLSSQLFFNQNRRRVLDAIGKRKGQGQQR